MPRRLVMTCSFVGLVAGTALVARPSSASTVPEPAPTSSCAFNGQPALCPGIWFGSADTNIAGITTSQDGVTLTATADFDSTFYVDVRGEAESSVDLTTGEWLMNGEWNMDAEKDGLTGRAEVDVNLVGSLSGSPSLMYAAGRLQNTGTFDFEGTSQAINNSEALTGIAITVEGGTCVEAVGSWQMNWADMAADVGWKGTDSITGGFTAVRQPGMEADTFNEVAAGGTRSEVGQQALSDNVRALLSAQLEYNFRKQEAAIGFPVSDEIVGQMLDALDDVQSAIAALANELACEPALNPEAIQRSRRVTGEALQSVIDWVASSDEKLSGATLRRLAIASVSTSATGAAATGPQTAATEEALQSIFVRHRDAEDGASIAAHRSERDFSAPGSAAEPATDEIAPALADRGVGR